MRRWRTKRKRSDDPDWMRSEDPSNTALQIRVTESVIKAAELPGSPEPDASTEQRTATEEEIRTAEKDR